VSCRIFLGDAAPHGEFVLVRYEGQTAVHVYVHEHVHVNVHAYDQIGKHVEVGMAALMNVCVVDVDVNVNAYDKH
jgi:hypothetical protein